MSRRVITEKLGIGISWLNYCLKLFINKGCSEVQSFSKSGFGYDYLFTSQGVVEKVALAGRFLKRKVTEHEQVQVEIDALRSADADGQKAYSL